jgi:hypothetical protein
MGRQCGQRCHQHRLEEGQGQPGRASRGGRRCGFGSLRYGSNEGDSTFYRVYGKYANRDGFRTIAGEEGVDDWQTFRSGFRLDHAASSQDTFTFLGDLYETTAGVEYGIPSLFPPFGRRGLPDHPSSRHASESRNSEKLEFGGSRPPPSDPKDGEKDVLGRPLKGGVPAPRGKEEACRRRK